MDYQAFDFEALMRYFRACNAYHYHQHTPTEQAATIALLEHLGGRWWKQGLVMYGYDATLEWLYSQFTPEQLAPLYYECSINRLILENGKSILKGAILLIVNGKVQAALSLPDARWKHGAYDVSAIYPDHFNLNVPLNDRSSMNYHIYRGDGKFWWNGAPDVKLDSFEAVVDKLTVIPS